ncbi:MAG: hypothetical protein J0H54_13505, partial [Rhizobiales bacterium]|nr:hypothetical protein [Hyphomicrobiales bacterium]
MIVSAISEKTNFGAGEVSPWLRARRDLARNQIALARLENMITVVEGVVTRRPGTMFGAPLRTEAERGKLFRFRYANGDTFALAFNGGKVRLFRDGGQVLDGPSPYEFTVPYVEADLPNLRIVQSGNALYGVDGAKQPRVIRRVANTNWTVNLYQPVSGPVDEQNTDVTKTILASAVTGTGITLTATAGLITSDAVGTVWRIDEHSLADTALWTSGETALTVGARRRWNGNIYAVASGTDAGASPPTHEDGDWSSGNGKVTWTFLNRGYGYVRIVSITSATVAVAD